MTETASHTVLSATEVLLAEILGELKRGREQDGDLWEAEHIADHMKLSKKSVQNKVLKMPGFPSSIVLPTGGRRWVAKEVKAWALRRR